MVVPACGWAKAVKAVVGTQLGAGVEVVVTAATGCGEPASASDETRVPPPNARTQATIAIALRKRIPLSRFRWTVRARNLDSGDLE
jgi:hypothetical protein